MARLTALKVMKLSAPGMYPDGAGLYLQVTGTANKSWLYRYTLFGRAREMGLGSFTVVSLAEAREKAAAARKLKSDGVDPIEHRNAQRAAARLEVAKAITFAECATAYIAAHETGWKNAKHRYQWRQTIDSYINPTLGKLPVSAVDTGLVLKVLQKIWTTKPETAGRVRSRIENILGWATVREYRSGDNPARWRGHLDKLLTAHNKVRKVEHHPAMPYEDVSAFITELRKQNGVAAQALEFVILTASRTGEAINAEWSEIDMSAKIWAVPAERMKSSRPHRVPLSDAAVTILNRLRQEAPIKAGSPDPDAPVFTSGKRGVPISNMAMLQLLRRMGHGDITVHGYRSTFRDWARECTNFPRDIAEEALSHVLADKTEAAYQRRDALEKRRRLMDAWAKFATAARPVRPAVTGALRAA